MALLRGPLGAVAAGPRGGDLDRDRDLDLDLRAFWSSRPDSRLEYRSAFCGDVSVPGSRFFLGMR